MRVSKEQNDKLHKMHVLLGSIRWDRVDEYNDMLAESLQQYTEQFPDYCSMSCSSHPLVDWVEMIRSTVALYEQLKARRAAAKEGAVCR